MTDVQDVPSAGVSGDQFWQLVVERITAPRYSRAAANMYDSIANDSTLDYAEYPPLIAPAVLTCRGCQTGTEFIAQGRWGAEATLVCVVCGTLWTPTWRQDDDWRLETTPGAFNRDLLKKAITAALDSGQQDSLTALTAVTALRDALRAGTWEPEYEDPEWAWELLEHWHGEASPRALAEVMPFRMWGRTPELSDALARSIGLLSTPEAQDTEEASRLRREVKELAVALCPWRSEAGGHARLGG